MNSNGQARELLEENKSFIEKPDFGWILRVIVLAFIIAVGFYALTLQITKGHLVTGMRDNVVWGVYIVNFVFILGLSYAGAV